MPSLDTSDTVPRPPLRRRMLAGLGRIALTLMVAAAAAGAVVGARAELARRAEAVPVPEPAPVTPVAVARIDVVGHHEVARRFSGQFEARQETALASERAGTVSEVLVREGDAVAEGQVVARLDTRLLEAERARLAASRAGMTAQVELARRTDARQDELRRRGFATDQAVDDTSLTLARLEAGIAEIDAALETLAVNLAKSVVTAPFAGRVSSRTADAGAVVAPGAPVATLLEDAPPRFRVGLDPALAAGLTEGSDAVIHTGGTRLPGRLSSLAPDLDPATRSRTAFFDVVIGPAPPDRATGEIAMTQRVEGSGAWVPLSALRQGPRGTWTLLTVSDGVVGVEAAEVGHVEAERAFVRGTFEDGALYIPGGTHRVVPGQPVAPLPGPAAEAARGSGPAAEAARGSDPAAGAARGSEDVAWAR